MPGSPSPWSPPRLVGTTTADGVRLAGRLWLPDSRNRLPFRDSGVTVVRPVYVVAHGFTGSTSERRVGDICERLAARGSPVVAFDFRGHGESAGGSTLGDVEIRDLAAAITWTRDRFDAPLVAAGWSMGGSVVLRYAGLGGDADVVVSVSSPGLWYERGTRSMRVVHWAAETRRGRILCRLLTGTRLTYGWQTMPESPIEVVGRIAPRPLLLVHGDVDTYFPVRHATGLAAAAPDATFWLEAGMGHAETATTPELVDRIAAWVDDRLAGSSPRATMSG